MDQRVWIFNNDDDDDDDDDDDHVVDEDDASANVVFLSNICSVFRINVAIGLVRFHG